MQQATKRLDLLINNAGIGSGGPQGTRQTSADGYELRFAVNYLAGFLLTHLLLPLVRTSTPARIVNVSSLGQQAIDFADVMLTHGYSGSRAYCQSKLAQIMFTIDLARELDGTGVTVNALHPATYMNTTMVRQSGVTPMSSVEQGADAILNLATSAALDGRSGLFFNGQREARADAQAYDPAARQRLKTLSLELSGLSVEGTRRRLDDLASRTSPALRHRRRTACPARRCAGRSDSNRETRWYRRRCRTRSNAD